MSIRVLDTHTAELIAAGEVVERPSSVIKELVENALDAGATSISVDIEKGGIALMRVQDNGSGIPSDEIPLAFLRHATSKVRTQEDLEVIMTLGFRGEALASIASVAQVELLTKTTADEFASLYTIAGGKEQDLQPAARPEGTTFTIRNLFYNTPARMKFLKKDASEGTFVTETMTRLALSRPDISFKFCKDKKQVFATPGDGSLNSAVYAVLGAEFARELQEVDGGTAQYKVSGLVTPPRAVRASRSMQFFYINGRFVKNRTMMAALEQACRGMIMQGKFPGCILFLQMPPQLVDVNVHPAKTEVRFARESDVFDAVYGAVKSTFMQRESQQKSFDFANQNKTSLAPSAPSYSPAVGNATVQRPKPEQAQNIPQYMDVLHTLVAESEAIAYEHNGPRSNKQHTEVLADALDNAQSIDVNRGVLSSEPAQTALYEEDPINQLRFIGEIFKTYILAQAGDTLCLLDKHAAHERILYEKLAAAKGNSDIQQMLTPAVVNLSAMEKNALLQNVETLQTVGLEIEDFGGNGVLVRGVPSNIPPNNVQDLVEEVAQRMALNNKDTSDEKSEWVLHSMACRAAVKAGDSTPVSQLLQLAKEILAGEIPPFCPHGRPVVVQISRKELEKQFGRLG